MEDSFKNKEDVGRCHKEHGDFLHLLTPKGKNEIRFEALLFLKW